MADVTQTVTEPMITLVEGTSFAISTTAGEVVGGGVHGLYHQASRVVPAGRSCWTDGGPNRSRPTWIVDDVESAPAYPRGEPVQDTQPAVRLRWSGSAAHRGRCSARTHC
jgi:hypothetical protein